MAETKLTPKLAQEILNHIRVGNFRKHAAGACGVSERTMKNWMRWGQLERAKEPYKSFAENVIKAENEAISAGVLCVQSAATQDWKAAKFYLERKASKEWGNLGKQSVKAQIELILQVVENVCGQQTAARVFTEIAARTSAQESAENTEGTTEPSALN